MAVHVVTVDDTASSLGSGDVPVLATPRLIAWIEAATVAACPEVGDDETSVGTRVDIEHLAASPIGASVDAVADLVHRDGRLLRFSVAAHHDVGDGPVLVARGEVTRIVVRRRPFLERTIAPLLIREAVPQEWPEIGDLCVTAYATGYGLGADAGDYVEFLRDVPRRAPGATVLVCRVEGRLVGTVTLIQSGQPGSEISRPGEAEFRFMAVDPAAWRSGVGRALVEAVVARAGDRPVICSVIEGNDPAVALYLSCGFTREPGRDHEPAPGVRLAAYVRRPTA